MALTSTQRPEPALLSSKPSSAVPASLKIAHVQLRNLVVCPKEQGVVWYVGDGVIVEQDVRDAQSEPHILAQMMFIPVCLDAIPLDDDTVLLAAGGQEAELFLGLYSFLSKSVTVANEDDGPSSSMAKTYRASEEIWRHVSILAGSINNSVMLYVPPIPRSTAHEYYGLSEVPFVKPYPRLVVSNNDCSVKVFEINTALEGFGRKPISHVRAGRLRRDEPIERYQRIGSLKLSVPINHTSISPDGSTLLSCGDSPTIHLHRISPWAPGMPMKFEHLASYMLPQSTSDNSSTASTPPISPYLPYAFVDGQWTVGGGPSCSCFSTAWNSDGSKFAVASQEGAVVVWDVRSGEPLPKARWETSQREFKRPDIPSPLNSLSQASPQTHPHLFPQFAMGILDEREFDRAAAAIAAEGAAASRGDESLQSLYTDPWAHFDPGVQAPSWGVRCIKFSRNANGQEVLVFTEHASFIHVIDAATFEKHDIIRIPHVRPSATVSLASMSAQPHVVDPDQAYHLALAAERRRISGSPFDLSTLQHHRSLYNSVYPTREVTSSSAPVSYSYLDVPRVLSPVNPLSRSPEPMISELGQDGFNNNGMPSGQNFSDRAGGASSAAAEGNGRQSGGASLRRPRHFPVRRGGSARTVPHGPQPYSSPPTPSSGSTITDDESPVVVIPPFAREEDEAGVRETLTAHGITVLPSSRRRRRSQNSTLVQVGDEASTVASSSTAPSHASGSSSSSSSQSTDTLQTSEPSDDDISTIGINIEIDDAMSDNECSTPILPPPPIPRHLLDNTPPPPPSAGSTPITTTHPSPPVVQSLPPCQDLIESTDRLDIGGIAFDPSGAYLYVATVDGISEWSIKGAKTKWWSKGGWL